MRQTRQVTRAREDDDRKLAFQRSRFGYPRAREDDDPTLAELERLLVIQLGQDLDLDDPQDYDLYCQSRDLLEHIRETLENVRVIHEQEAER